jgi:hypothetical protein
MNRSCARSVVPGVTAPETIAPMWGTYADTSGAPGSGGPPGVCAVHGDLFGSPTS